MKEPTPLSSQFAYTGRYFDISLGDAATLEQSLQDKSRGETFVELHDEDALPYPVRSVSIESYWDTDESRFATLSGVVAIRPTSLESAEGVWPHTILDEIESSLPQFGYNAKKLHHDPLALYIALDASRAIRIALSSNHVECTIEIHTVEITEINVASHSELETNDETLNDADALVRLAAILGSTIDLLHDTYGKPAKHAQRYSVKCIPQRLVERIEQDGSQLLGEHATDLVVVHSTELVLVEEPRPIDAPEIETLLNSGATFADLGGNDRATNRLKEIGDIFMSSELAKLYGISSNPILLHGPPGTGKSSLVEALAHYTGAKFRDISSSDIMEKWVGSSSQNLDEIMNTAYELNSPIILFFDEIDAFADKNKAAGTVAAYLEVQRALQRHLSKELPNYPHVLVAAATNTDIDTFAPALVRAGRFETIPVGMPTEKERLDIWHAALSKIRRGLVPEWGTERYGDGSLSPIKRMQSYDLLELATLSDQMTGADIVAAIKRALMICYRNHVESGNFHQLTQDMLIWSIRNSKR